MNTDLAVVLALLAAAIAMFALNKPRMDAVALLMLTVLPLTGVITMGEALAGFSDSSIVLLGALFVIGEGLVRTGVAQRLGDWLLQKAGQQRDPAHRAADGGRRRARGLHELDGRRGDLHPGRAAHRAEHRRGPEPADDAALLRGADQRHADAGRHGAESGRQQRARPPRRGGLPLLQLHALRPAGAGPGHPLHALRTPLARRRRAARRPRRRPAAEPPRVDRAVQARGPRVPAARDGAVAAGGQDARRGRSARHGRREHRRHRAQAPAGRETSSAPPPRRSFRRATSCWSTCSGRRSTSRRSGASSRSRPCRSPTPTSATGRRRSAWRRSWWPPTPSSSARRWSRPSSAPASG